MLNNRAPWNASLTDPYIRDANGETIAQMAVGQHQNARLIAASPDLLAACREAQIVLERHAQVVKDQTMSACDVYIAIKNLTQAIAQAEGRTA